MRDHDTDAWIDAVEVDRAIRSGLRGIRGQVFLHRSGVPLDRADLSTAADHGQLDLWPNECEGCAVSDRSSSAEVRNPLLQLPAAQNAISATGSACGSGRASAELSFDARERAERSWRQNKAPMAVYWKAVAVYAGHLYRIARLTGARRDRASATRASEAEVGNGAPGHDTRRSDRR